MEKYNSLLFTVDQLYVNIFFSSVLFVPSFYNKGYTYFMI